MIKKPRNKYTPHQRNAQLANLIARKHMIAFGLREVQGFTIAQSQVFIWREIRAELQKDAHTKPHLRKFNHTEALLIIQHADEMLLGAVKKVI